MQEFLDTSCYCILWIPEFAEIAKPVYAVVGATKIQIVLYLYGPWEKVQPSDNFQRSHVKALHLPFLTPPSLFNCVSLSEKK